MPSRSSGKWSIAGFVYQMVGLGGLVALAHDVPTDGDDDVALLVRVLPGLRGEHEGEDRDGVLLWALPTGENAATVVQFKHSGITPPKKIYRGEFVEIVDRLIQTSLPSGSPDYPVTKYALVTNRPLSDELDACLEPAGHRLRTWCTGCDLEESLETERLAALSNMAFISGSVTDWEDALHRFARRRGCFDDEIEAGVDRLIGYIARSTAASPDPVTITEVVLLQAVTGSGQVRLLMPDTATRPEERMFTSFRDDRARTRGAVVRREKDVELWAQVGTHPVVLVTGRGGSGKTVALWNSASHEADNQAGSGGFADVRYAPEVSDHWVQDLVRKWRETEPAQLPRDESATNSIGRLVVANPDLDRPVLHLGVDGMDVYLPTQSRNAIRDLIRSLVQLHESSSERQAPPCTLVMTCRTKNELDRVLFLGRGYDSPDFEGIAQVEFGDFEPEFLAYGVLDTAEANGIDREIAGRLSSALFRLSSTDATQVLSEPLGSSGAAAGGGDQDVPEHVLSALRHPAMWRAFLDPDVREVHQAILNGDQGGLSRLAKVFVRRFEHQTEERMGDKLIRTGMVQDVLQSVALWMAQKPATVVKRNQWTQAAAGLSDVSPVVSVKLRDEAESFGVLTRAGDAWTWRHSFVGEYLAAV
jgi:hypothetical protein